MKKVIMFACALMAAVAVNAASFQWANSAVNGVDSSGNVVTSTDGLANFTLAYLGMTGSESFDNAVAVGDIGTWSVKSAKGKNTATVNGSYNGTSAANGGSFANGQVYAVMVVDDQGTLHQLLNADGSANAATYTVTGYSGDTWAGSQFKFATSNYAAEASAYATPEPTSGLLLLLGGAMLALRRKQKRA